MYVGMAMGGRSGGAGGAVAHPEILPAQLYTPWKKAQFVEIASSARGHDDEAPVSRIAFSAGHFPTIPHAPTAAAPASAPPLPVGPARPRLSPAVRPALARPLQLCPHGVT